MIYFWELQDDADEYEQFGKMTDDGEIIEGEERLLNIFPQEHWEETSVDRILSQFSNGRVMASHEPPEDSPAENAN